MMMRRGFGTVALLLAVAILAGCGARMLVPHSTMADSPPVIPPAPALPELVVDLEGPLDLPLPGSAQEDPLAAYPPGNPVTLAARGADVGSLLVALAEEAGISLVIDPTIQDSRITVNFVDVPAREALRAVLTAAGLGIAAGPPTLPAGPTVFYALPVHIDFASAELIQARFGVSPVVARWIVENRLP